MAQENSSKSSQTAGEESKRQASPSSEARTMKRKTSSTGTGSAGRKASASGAGTTGKSASSTGAGVKKKKTSSSAKKLTPAEKKAREKARKKAAAAKRREAARKEREERKLQATIEKEARLEEKQKKRTGKVGRFFTRTPLKIALYVVILALLGVFAYYCFDFGRAVFSEEGVDPEPGYTQTAEIEPGMNAYEIGQLLEEQALIDSRWVFLVQSYIFQLKITSDTAGTYKFNSSYCGEDIIKMINNLEKVE